VHSHNMSNARVEQCRDEYRLVAGYNVFKQRTLLFPVGWKDTVTRYEHANLWPLSLKMHNSHIVRFMLMEQTYAFSGKWLDATSGNGVDDIALESYDNFLHMLRYGLRTVYVKDVQNVLTRGRTSQRAQRVFEDRDLDFDNMMLSEVKRLVRIANHEWQAHKNLFEHFGGEGFAV
jgi:hypothetical protein